MSSFNVYLYDEESIVMIEADEAQLVKLSESIVLLQFVNKTKDETTVVALFNISNVLGYEKIVGRSNEERYFLEDLFWSLGHCHDRFCR